jgi:DNA primase
MVTESGLDALSKQAIEGRRDTLYLSAGGALSSHQVEQIRGPVRQHRGAEVVAAFDRDQGGDRYTKAIREALPRATDGRADLEAGQDWNDKLRQDQQAQAERQRTRDRGQRMSR